MLNQVYHNTPMPQFPMTRESIVTAYTENCVQRAAMGIPLLPVPSVDAEGSRLVSGVATLDHLCEQFGFDRVQHWLDLLRASDEGVK